MSSLGRDGRMKKLWMKTAGDCRCRPALFSSSEVETLLGDAPTPGIVLVGAAHRFEIWSGNVQTDLEEAKRDAWCAGTIPFL